MALDVISVTASLAVVLVLAIDDDLAEACGEKPSWFCEAGWNLTHNRMLSRGADWFVTRPLVAILVLLVAWILARSLRKGVTAFVNRLSTSRKLASGALQRIGVERSKTPPMVDPREESRARTLAAVARACVSWFVWTIAVLVVLGLFHINLGPLLAGAGIAGIAIGFGAQALVKDCISGFFMLLEDQCGVGDEVDISADVTGTVEAITLRMTTVRGADGTLWNVPNGTILRVGNKSRNWSQGLLDITIANEADVDGAMAAIERGLATAAEVPSVAEVLLAPPSILGVERVETTGTVIRVAVRTQPGKQWAAMREMRQAVRSAMNAPPTR